MNTLTKLLSSAAVAALIAAPALADQTQFSAGVENVVITNNIPAINLTVRNVAASTDPADRHLRMVSQLPVIPVQGQLFCNDDLSGHVRIQKARIMFGVAHVQATPNGADLIPIGPWSPSDFQMFNADYPQTNFSINAPLNIASEGSGLVNFAGFNAVDLVEDRMEFFVENGAGSEADFMRVDDVFETTITLNAVGWCTRTTGNANHVYAGVRSIEVPVHVFYQRDADIQDVVQTVGGAGSVTAPVPSRARGTASTRGSNGAPPARNSRPSRADQNRVDSGNQTSAGLLLPAVQQARQSRSVIRAESGETGYVMSPVLVSSNHDQPRRGGVRVATGDINNDGRSSRGLILPAVQSAQGTTTSIPRHPRDVQRSRGDTTLGNSAQQADEGLAAVEPEEIDARATAPRTSALDALMVINTVQAETGGTTALFLPAVQEFAGVEPDEIDNRFVEDTSQNADCPTIGSVVRREATNALIGAVFGSRGDDRNRDRRSTRERLTDDAIDRMTEC